MRVLLIANHVAGRGLGEALLQPICARLRRSGWEVEPRLTRARHQATAFARQAEAEGYEAVVVAGGDGLVNEVANALWGSAVAVGVLPLGTGNVLARELGIPLAWRAACDLLPRCVPRAVDVGRAGDRHFVLMAGFGWDAEIVAQAHRAVRPLGIVKYLPVIAKRLRGTPFAWKIETESLAWEDRGFLLLACSASLYTWRFRFFPQARLNDGVLDCILFRGCSVWRVLSAMARGLLGGPLPAQHFRVFQATRLRVESQPPAPVQVDGDWLGEVPMEISLRPKALLLLVPPGHYLARTEE